MPRRNPRRRAIHHSNTQHCKLSTSPIIHHSKLSTLHCIDAPQEWGLAIQRHPANYQAIKFRSRFNAKPCLALFHRDDLEKRLKEKKPTPLPKDAPATDWLTKHEVSLY